jgi:hypothetical protein
MAREEGKRGMSTQPGEVSAASLQKALEGISYPARKRDLEETAKRNNAPSPVMDVIKQLPDHEYKSPVDVSKSFSEIR